jgi:hypothetical protein
LSFFDGLGYKEGEGRREEGRREEGRREGLEEALFVIVGRGGWRRKRASSRKLKMLSLPLFVIL